MEGEEESGSYGFQDVVTQNKSLIGEIDWVLLSNSYWLDDNVPCLNYGLRGVIAANVEIYSDKPDRHSGMDGGLSREPTIDLINILSKLNNDEGQVRLPNFYNTIKEATQDELKLYEEITAKSMFLVQVTPQLFHNLPLLHYLSELFLIKMSMK
ncbi:unnamed protein product [Ambrosiozyma monospora]|uniref:Unnamed protein product n=1 Tax=Ambrosiozyma monospora TaxID=43982 RepID=A0ACB5UAL0_AMBMO|nr:unnamed protein product [Ambrosiozyma monospora]